MSKITILYGEMGAGKNYHGTRLAKLFGGVFLDGDDAMPPEMREKVQNFKPLSPEILQDFIHNHLVDSILDTVRTCNHLVVAQALYRREDREKLGERLQLRTGVTPEFIHIKVPVWQNARQLWSRPKGHLWVLYWLLNKPFFQKGPDTTWLF